MGRNEWIDSDDHCIYYCGWESLRRNGVALRVNKSLKCCTWVQSQKWHNDLCSFSRQTIQHHSNPSLSQLLMLKKLKLNGSMKTYRPSRTNTKKDVLFIIGLEYKSRKSRDTWNNKQAWPWSTKCSIWMQSQKWQNDLSSFSRQTIQYHGNPSLCPDQ